SPVSQSVIRGDFSVMEVNEYGEYRKNEPCAEADIFCHGHGALHRHSLFYTELFIRSVSDPDRDFSVRSFLSLSVPGFTPWSRQFYIEYAVRRLRHRGYAGRLHCRDRSFILHCPDQEKKVEPHPYRGAYRAGAGAGGSDISVLFS